MINSLVYLACLLTLAAHPAAVHGLPIPPVASGILPLRYHDFNAQRPFSRPPPPPRLRFAADAHEADHSAPFAATPSPVTADTIFADSVLPGGVEASLAAVMASRQMEQLDRLEGEELARLEKKVRKEKAKRDWVVPGQPRVRTANALSRSSTSLSHTSTVTSAWHSASLPSFTPVLSTTATPSSTTVKWYHAPQATPAVLLWHPSFGHPDPSL
ncbi:hypothetical protein JCM10213v2_007220 [Rhodosporidiobolus nylandii]